MTAATLRSRTAKDLAQMARQHNDANVLGLGARVIGIGTAKSIVDAFLKHEFLGERHAIRVNMINEIDNKYRK
jgi:ribose 5-phosphate isomerase B